MYSYAVMHSMQCINFETWNKKYGRWIKIQNQTKLFVSRENSKQSFIQINSMEEKTFKPNAVRVLLSTNRFNNSCTDGNH